MKESAPPDIRGLFAQAVGHHQAGRLDQAIAGYRQILAARPDLAPAHNNLGNALCEQGKWEEAEASYRHALSLQPNLAGTHNNLGTVLFERDKLGEAVGCYRSALALDPNYVAALDNLGAALYRQGKSDQAEASIRQALAIDPDFASAHDNLALLLWQHGRPEEALVSVRHALVLAPAFTRALGNLGFMLKELGRVREAIAVYRQLLQINPQDTAGLNGLAETLAAQGDAEIALETALQSLAIKDTGDARRIFAQIAVPLRWTRDSDRARKAMVRALMEAWARPADLARSATSLIKQNPRTGACIARAAAAWPQLLSSRELFGKNGAAGLADDRLLLALLISAQNTDLELERFLTAARRVLLDAAESGDAEELEFHAALARQCFINEYVFFAGDEEIHRASKLRDLLSAALEAGLPISPLRLLAVAAYFPLHSLSGAVQLLDRAWPGEVAAVLVQQVSEPQEEAQLRTTIRKLTPIDDSVSRLVRTQYEENPYPRWIRIPLTERPITIAGYLRQKFPFAVFQRKSGAELVELLSAGCGTGQLILEIAHSVTARILAVDLSLKSLGYANRKAREMGITDIEFAQADLLELGDSGRSFDVVECSGVLHHLDDPFAGWRTLLPLVRPGGFMAIGLYSRLARRGIQDARAFIAREAYGSSADEIRRCRQALLSRDGLRSGIAASDDFYGISSCRDLLFHVQEQQVQLPAIAAFLKENDLTFLGFETDGATLGAYRRRFPNDPAATDLGQWDAFEQENPGTFAGMYRFWIQKSAA